MRIHPLLSVGVVSALLATGAVVTQAGDDRHDNDRDRGHELDSKAREIQIGYDVAPVVLDTRGKNPLLVGLGSYIVNAQGSCNDCHTWPNFATGGNPYRGEPEVINSDQYLAGGRLFGPFKSKNLTPDAFGRPAGLTFEAFENLLRTGRDPDELGPNGFPRILQVMPWPVIGKMTDLDLRAIYEYLRAIPSLPDNPSPQP
jgi:hypothetical protein